MHHKVGDLVTFAGASIGMIVAIDCNDLQGMDHMSYVQDLRKSRGRAIYYALFSDAGVHGPFFGDELIDAN